jgi:hypothetical protein
VVEQVIVDLDDTLVVVDEFHNLSWKDVHDQEMAFYRLLLHNMSLKILFMSATPRRCGRDTCGDL